MGKRISNDLSLMGRLLLCLCLCSLTIHVFVDLNGHFNSPGRFQPFAEHRGELDHSEYEHEDDFIPFGLLSVTDANPFGSKTISANCLVFSQSIPPLLPPPIVT